MDFAKIVYNLKKAKKNQVISQEVVKKLESIHEGIQGSGQKMFSATKFIDYFVHDILDYTILNKQEKNFTKNISVIDIREGIKELSDIMLDKVEMKAILLEHHYKNFEEGY